MKNACLMLAFVSLFALTYNSCSPIQQQSIDELVLAKVDSILQHQKNMGQSYYLVRKTQLDSSIRFLQDKAMGIKEAIDGGKVAEQNSDRAVIEYYQLQAKASILQEIKQRDEHR